MQQLHKLWTKAVGQPDYNKEDWMALEAAINELKNQLIVKDRQIAEAAEMLSRCQGWERITLDKIVEIICESQQEKDAKLLTCVVCSKPHLTGFQVGPKGAICMECVQKGLGVPLNGHVKS